MRFLARRSTRHLRRQRSRRLAARHTRPAARDDFHGQHGRTANTENGAIGQFTPDGTEIITVGFGDHRVLAWDAATGAPHGDLLGGRIVTEGLIDFSPDAKIIAAAGLDGSFTLWDRASERKLAHVDTGRTGLDRRRLGPATTDPRDHRRPRLGPLLGRQRTRAIPSSSDAEP